MEMGENPGMVFLLVVDRSRPLVAVHAERFSERIQPGKRGVAGLATRLVLTGEHGNGLAGSCVPEGEQRQGSHDEEEMSSSHSRFSFRW
jgi:hypothetical protein